MDQLLYIYIYTYTYIHITTSRRDVTMHMMVNVRASIPKWPNIPIISIHYCCLVISYRSRIAPCYSLRWPQQGVPDGAGDACQFGPCFETWAMGIYALSNQNRENKNQTWEFEYCNTHGHFFDKAERSPTNMRIL